MKAIAIGLGLCVTVVTAAGCGSTSSASSAPSKELTLSGTVSPSARKLDNARAVALSAAGKTYWAYVSPTGTFALKVPTGDAYKVVLTNARAAGGRKVVGHIVWRAVAGASSWINIEQGGAFDVGTLRARASRSAMQGAAIKTKSSDGSNGSGGGASSGDDGHDHAHDYDCHEDDKERNDICEESGSNDDNDKDVELECDHEPGDAVKGDDSGKQADDEKEKEDEAEKETHTPCGAPADGGSTPPPPSDGGAGSSCTTNADCPSNLVCAASRCVPPTR